MRLMLIVTSSILLVGIMMMNDNNDRSEATIMMWTMERSDWVVEPLGEYVDDIPPTTERSEGGGGRNNHDEPLGEAVDNCEL